MSTPNLAAQIKDLVHESRNDLVEFLCKLVEVRSITCNEGDAVSLVQEKMNELGYDEVQIDSTGNVIGRIGTGSRVLVFDAHLDVVDAEAGGWDTPPFSAVKRDDRLYGRGTVDDKGPFVCALYAGHIAKRLGLGDDLTIYVIGSVVEEDCEGLALGACIEGLGLTPDAVVIAESSELQLCRGHRGRALISAAFEGTSVHASRHNDGVNPLELAAPFLAGLPALDSGLPETPPLGKGSVVSVDLEVSTNSRSTIPHRVTVYVDRRTTTADTRESILAELQDLPGGDSCSLEYVQWEAVGYNEKNLTGEEYFPAWVIDEDHSLVQAGVSAYRSQMQREPTVTTWGFSTNGNYTMGRRGFPTIGFGPGQMSLAHGPNEHIRIGDLAEATAFYAQLIHEVDHGAVDG